MAYKKQLGRLFDYFWMSYETYSLADTVWVFDMSAEDGLDNNYQLDGGLHTATVGYYTGAANVFMYQKKKVLHLKLLSQYLYLLHRQQMLDIQLIYILTLKMPATR